MGGVGKSQIAIEYAYRNAAKYSSVYWVDATNERTLATSGQRILKTLVNHYAKRYPGEVDFPQIAIDLGVPGQIDREGKLTDGEAVKAP
jgi:hypothetical protein